MDVPSQTSERPAVHCSPNLPRQGLHQVALAGAAVLDARRLHHTLPASPRWWQWPTVLSLDAPAVALAWQALLAGVAHIALTRVHVFVLGASVWLAYVADRWIEGWRLEPGQTRTQRHRFYQRYRWPTAALWLFVFTLDLTVAVAQLREREIIAGLLLLLPVLAYLLSHQLVHRDRRWRAPKEVCVAVLLAGGVAVFPAAQPGAALPVLAAPLGLFALLCFTNCALISVWEHEIDATHQQTSFSHQFRGGAALSRTFPWMLALVAALTALAETGETRTAALCATASAILLGALDAGESRVGWQLARVLADAALLTPVLPLLLGHR